MSSFFTPILPKKGQTTARKTNLQNYPEIACPAFFK
ncbi:MAG: hypothetical protein ACFWT7_05540 [Succiniclasticum sp.]|jgi:hypothetical protein